MSCTYMRRSAVAAGQRGHELFTGLHYSPRGNAIVARELELLMRRRGLLPARPTSRPAAR